MIDRSALEAAVRRKVETLRGELLAKVEANLSGEVLQERSGALKRSIAASLVERDDAFEVSVASTVVPMRRSRRTAAAPHRTTSCP